MKTHRIPIDSAFKRIALVVILGLLCATGVRGARATTQATTFVTFTCCSYTPAKIFITAGDDVNWQGSFSMHPLASDNGLWATRSSGTSFSFTFQNPGDFRYHCTIHGGTGGMGMSGEVIVTGPFTAYVPLIVK